MLNAFLPLICFGAVIIGCIIAGIAIYRRIKR